jgi:NADPH2:quinone reductase
VLLPVPSVPSPPLLGWALPLLERGGAGALSGRRGRGRGGLADVVVPNLPAVAGGVGMAAVDIGQALGLEVVACASSDEKLAACSAAGASTLVKYGDDAASGDFKTALKNAGVYGAVDIVLDPVGGGYSEVALRSMGWGGRFVVVGFAAGGTTPDSAIPRLPLNHVLLNERQILGCFWGPWKERDRNALNRQHMATMMDMVQKGQLRCVHLISNT